MSVNDAGPESVREPLPASEARYRVLFDSIDEGFCIIEVLFDERGQPVDYRFLDMNRAFVAQTGLVNAFGRTIRELVPGHEAHWFEIYGRVALTGEPARFENEARHLDPPRFYDVYAFRHGAAEKRQVAVLFKDIGARKRAEEALRETESRYQDLIRHAPAGIYEIDFRRRRFVSVNDAMCAMLGYSRDELLAMDPFAILDEEGRTRFQGRVRSWLSGDAPGGNVEYAVRAKDGRILYVVLDVSFTKDAGGQPRGATVVAHDITARKQVEASLSESEERFRGIVETAEEGIATHDPDGIITYVNQRMADMLGYSREEMIGRSSLDFVNDDEREVVIRARESVRERGNFSKERKLRRKDGSTLWTLANVSRRRGGAGAPLGYLAMHTDITARKRAEEALEKANTLLAEAQRIARLGSWRWEISSGALTWSKETFELFGYEPGAVLPSYDRFLALVHPEDRSKVIRGVEEAVSGRTHYDLDFRLLRPDASVRWLHSSAEVSFDAGGRAAAMTGVVLDITEGKRAEEALREADRRKDEFIAILSHELRNPLAPIRYALPLLSEERLGEGGRRAVAVIDRQAAHLARLVDDLLDVSRITAGKIELRRDHVTLSALVAAAVEAASPAIAAGRHSLDIAVPDEPVWLNVDATRIAQAITNLLNNSAKYTPQGGRIGLQATHGDGCAVVRVSDNGIGIAPEALTTVFEMFRQVSSANRTQGGLGVGLTLARQFVEMHGGTIEAHSAGENAGAEFVIRLPLTPAGARRDEPREPGASGQPACLRVLVVDDNVDLADMLAMVVQAAGHDARKAFDGRSAVSAALEYQPHVMLLDIGMPGMSGFEVATELRRHPQMARTHIVALTGWGQAEDRRRTAQAGFDDHLTKPTDPLQIELILTEVAQRITASGNA